MIFLYINLGLFLIIGVAYLILIMKRSNDPFNVVADLAIFAYYVPVIVTLVNGAALLASDYRHLTYVALFPLIIPISVMIGFYIRERIQKHTYEKVKSDVVPVIIALSKAYNLPISFDRISVVTYKQSTERKTDIYITLTSHEPNGKRNYIRTLLENELKEMKVLNKRKTVVYIG